MLKDLSREQVAVVVTLKWMTDKFKRYNGKDKDFRKCLIAELHGLDGQVDGILASAFQP